MVRIAGVDRQALKCEQPGAAISLGGPYRAAVLQDLRNVHMEARQSIHEDEKEIAANM
jgi:hypothetical protein